MYSNVVYDKSSILNVSRKDQLVSKMVAFCDRGKECAHYTNVCMQINGL